MAKSFGLKSFNSIKVIASASPIANCRIELDVGDSLLGQASSLKGVKRMTSDFFASVEDRFEVIPIKIFPLFFKNGIKSIISRVFPLLEITKTISFGFTAPISPCKASAA